MIEICRWEELRIFNDFYNLHRFAKRKKQQKKMTLAGKIKTPSVSTWTLWWPFLSEHFAAPWPGGVSVLWSSQGAVVRCLAYVVLRCRGESAWKNPRWLERFDGMNFLLTKIWHRFFSQVIVLPDIKCRFIWKIIEILIHFEVIRWIWFIRFWELWFISYWTDADWGLGYLNEACDDSTSEILRVMLITMKRSFLFELLYVKYNIYIL